MMRIFLSYATEDRARVERVSLTLAGDGHHVFFDRKSIAPGDGFDRLIREQIEEADRFIFFISPASVQGGRYALSELKLASERWPHPEPHVLPVMLEDTPQEAIPAYLKAVKLLRAEGDLSAEISATIARSLRTRQRRSKVAAVIASGTVGIALLAHNVRGPSEERLVTHVARDAQGSIVALCNSEQAWSPRSRAKVIKDVQRKRHQYFAHAKGEALAEVEVREYANGLSLRTVSDNISGNNLSSLPECAE